METIREKLYTSRVVDFTLNDDKDSVIVEEACDNYFSVILTKEELGKLIDELNDILKEMI